mgnify:CR=1 FL=1
MEYAIKYVNIKINEETNIFLPKEIIKGRVEEIKKHEKSIRDMNNIVADTFLDIEYEILSNQGKYKTLKLTSDTVSKGNYDLS